MADAVSARDLARTAAEEVSRLGSELEEIELLVQQARNEAVRHEAKRAQLQERLGLLTGGRLAPPEEIREATSALASATRRASLMEAQVDVLRGKQRVLERFRDRLRFYAEALAGAEDNGSDGGEGTSEGESDGSPLDGGLSGRAIRDAQEDLRRDIARAMHDGPAQSLTNIALQAQIVQRLVSRDTERAVLEVAQLVHMVQQTLEATKTFIFDVRPMVLDDLGIVPTLRRTARDRGRSARIPVEFDSVGADRRLGPDLESSLFRIIDDAIAGYLTTKPARVSVRLDWADHGLHGEVRGIRNEETMLALQAGDAASAAAVDLRGAELGEDLPPALAAMIRDQRDDASEAAAAAREAVARTGALPADAWRGIAQRTRGVGIRAEQHDEGSLLVLDVSYPA